MEEGRVLFDASAYILFEASGDSESQCFDGGFELDSDDAAAAAEDDAQSCSYGSVSDSPRLHEVVDAGGDDFLSVDFDDCSVDEEDDGGGSDEEDGVVDQCRRRGKAAAKEKPAETNDREDSNVKMTNEREGDRQFWEACLAS